MTLRPTLRIRLRDYAARWPWTVLCLFVLLILAGRIQAQDAQDGSGWATAVNLSHSNAASSPAIVSLPDGTLRVLWWDQFEGLMLASGTISAPPTAASTPSPAESPVTWSEPSPVPIVVSKTVGQETVLTPIQAMPRIVTDGAGRAHAFWLGEPDRETASIPLLYSRLAPNSTSWSLATTLSATAGSFDAATDAAGNLHLAYVRPEQSRDLPAGLYYQQSKNGGANWSTPTLVERSQYFRLLATDEDHIRLTVDGAGGLCITWDDPRLNQVLITRSTNDGATWEEPRAFGALDGKPRQNQVVTAPGSPRLLLWEWIEGSSRVKAASSSGDTLTLAQWNGQRWSESRKLTFDFQNPELGMPVHLSDLEVAMVPLPANGGLAPDGTRGLAVAGIDQNGELWITGSPIDTLDKILRSSFAGSPTQLSAGGQTEAQAATMMNLSRSGAASNPAIAVGPDGSLRIFWWDQFDGLTVADGTLVAASVLSGTEEIPVIQTIWSEPRAVGAPVAATPQIVVDAASRIHAFWLKKATEGTEASSVMHSGLAADGTSWSPPAVLAESAISFEVVADASGELHLAYINSLSTPYSPVGLYHRRTSDGGANWGPPRMVQESRYLRLVTPEKVHLRLAPDDSGGILVTWDDPHLERVVLAYSPDGGATWQAAVPIGDPQRPSQRGSLISVPGAETLLLWQSGGDESSCNLYQATASQLLGGATGTGQQVLETMSICPENERFLPLGDSQVLMVADGGSDTLLMATWDGERWSEPRQMSFSFQDPELSKPIYLGHLQAALVGFPSNGGGSTDKALIVTGSDQEGDVWAGSTQMGAMGLVFAPPPPWSTPMSFHQSEDLPGLPTMAIDAEGLLHVMWSEASAPGESGTALYYSNYEGAAGAGTDRGRWTRPTRVLQSPEGDAVEPDLILAGDRLHLVWSGNQDGEIYYSRAFVPDAYTSEGWAQPRALPAPLPAGSRPEILADAGGTLHVVYAVPVNEYRGVYYTRSDDGGETWSPVQTVFDAGQAGWAMVDNPHLVVDGEGTIHVVWARLGLAASGLPQGIYYTCSRDGGQTWSAPFAVAEGAYAWPAVATSGTSQIYLVWQSTGAERGWWVRWSADGGTVWTGPEQLLGFDSVLGPAALTGDAAGAVYLMGLGQDTAGRPSLLYATWDGERWGTRATFRLGVEAVESGLAAVLQPELGRLDVGFRAELTVPDGTTQMGLWYSGRTILVAEATPAPTLPPRATATALSTAVPAPSPRPTLNLTDDSAPATGEPGSVPLPLVLGGGLATLIVAAVLGIRLFSTGRRY